ncbi:MAG: hypothetical protein N2Z62_00590 [Rhodobacteraceae bacterium]|nr:hypothetical protein [Paracoccaceae bacterium]
MRHGPGRGELVFRLVVSLAGLALLGAAVALHGLPSGPAFVEIGLLAGGFFGGTAGWSLWRLLRPPKD